MLLSTVPFSHSQSNLDDTNQILTEITQANSEEFSENADIFIHNPKISVAKYLGFDSTPIEFSIFVQNMNKTHSTMIELIPGSW